MPHNIILVGIGGTGSKSVESAIHWASVGNDLNIYPIIIDQDKENGNIQRLEKVINAYKILYELNNSINDKFFANKIEKLGDLLPIAPINEDINFKSAIEQSNMHNDEQFVLDALYTNNQLLDSIKNQGFKKRAHMGSLLFERFINDQEKLTGSGKGLKSLIEKLKSENNNVFIFASLFGGTGLSGFTNLGNFFKNNLPNSIINVVLYTPYFKIKEGKVEENPDAAIVKSDYDMLATKIALMIYRDKIFEIFDRIFLIGSDLKSLGEDYPTSQPFYYGKNQENKSHLFEFIVGSIIHNKEFLKHEQNKKGINELYNFVIDSKDSPPISVGGDLFRYIKLDNGIRDSFFQLINFAKLLCEAEKFNIDWWERQPWCKMEDRSHLINWAKLFYEKWYLEMSKWDKFKFILEDNYLVDTFKMSKYLSNKLGKYLPNLSNILTALSKINKIKTR